MQQQEFDRVTKANEIYNNDLVEQIHSDSYLVKGRYIVDILDNEYYTCTCKDYRYRSEGNCKHIISVQIYQLNNGAQ